ncbi:unnamed protein product [Orchesella dallaii]|uniref:C2H2-type domain-containing protein n=1 Tax=Orchesella dallaii TaxID=48710 RepID=A0ABP1R2P6_9HEXA
MEAGQDNQEAQIEEALEVVLVTPVYSFPPPAFGHSHQKRKSTPAKKTGKVNPGVSMIPTKGKPRNKTSSQRKWTKDNPCFVCHLCKYSTKLVKKLEDHLKLHDENSGYITCKRPKCNTLVLERKLLKHYQLKHSAPAAGKIINSDLQKLCEKCGEFYTNITRHRRQCKVDTKAGEERGPKEQDNSNPCL